MTIDDGLLLALLPYMPWVFPLALITRALIVMRRQLKGLR